MLLKEHLFFPGIIARPRQLALAATQRAAAHAHALRARLSAFAWRGARRKSGGERVPGRGSIAFRPGKGPGGGGPGARGVERKPLIGTARGSLQS